MKKQVFRVDPDGFNGAWYPAPSDSGRGLILMLGDSAEDYMARSGAKWLNRQGIHVMAMSADIWVTASNNTPVMIDLIYLVCSDLELPLPNRKREA